MRQGKYEERAVFVDGADGVANVDDLLRDGFELAAHVHLGNNATMVVVSRGCVACGGGGECDPSEKWKQDADLDDDGEID